MCLTSSKLYGKINNLFDWLLGEVGRSDPKAVLKQFNDVSRLRELVVEEI